jgi:hypothetical protein
MSRSACLAAAFGLAVCLLAPAALAAGNQPPAFTSTPPLEAVVGQFYLYDANATDPENDQLTYYLAFTIGNMAVDPTSGAFTWTPAKDGSQPISLYVTDGITSAVVQAFTVNVSKRDNQAPVFVSNPVRTALVGRPYTYDADATDPDGDRVYYSLDPQSPRAMTIDEATGVVSWMPGEEYRNQSVFASIIAKDIISPPSVQPYSIEVRAEPVVKNNPPGINGTPIISVFLGDQYYYKVNGTDLDGDPLTYSLALGPAAMKLNATTGVITWTPDPVDLGTVPIKINISDGKDTVPILFSISVKEKPIIDVWNVDPAPPNVSTEVMCFFLPGIVFMLQFALVLNGARKKLAAAPRRPIPAESRP